MSYEIKRIFWNATKEFLDQANVVFECSGSEYYIKKIMPGWHVIKCYPCQPAQNVYHVTEDREGYKCNCISGQKNLTCRHKEMVSLARTDPFGLNEKKKLEKQALDAKILTNKADALLNDLMKMLGDK